MNSTPCYVTDCPAPAAYALDKPYGWMDSPTNPHSWPLPYCVKHAEQRSRAWSEGKHPVTPIPLDAIADPESEVWDD